MTTHTIASWRDLTDQLTAEQIARLERDEARGEPRDNPAELLSQARWGAARNAAQARYADVPMPGGMEASV